MTAALSGARMAEAAAAFLDTLAPEQRSIAQWPFADQAERERWFYTPTDHGGLPLSSMTPRQQRAAHVLLTTGLSRSGYVSAAVVIGLENILDELEGHVRDWARERGRDPGLYYWRVFGDPSGPEPWSWRVGGHHISVSHMVIDGQVVATTPLFLGADPASSPLAGPLPLRPFGAIEDVAHELVASLDDRQRSLCIASPVAPVDIVACNRPQFGLGDGDLSLPLPEIWRGRLPEPWNGLAHDVHVKAEESFGTRPEHREAVRLTRVPRGVPASQLDASQREVLVALLHLYTGRLPEGLAEVETRKFSGPDLDSVHFLWAGATEPGQGYYYRIQSPTFLAECDNTQRGANHLHSVWRDPYRDFGRDPLAEHYANSAH